MTAPLGLLTLVFVVCAIALAYRLRRDRGADVTLQHVGLGALLLLPGALVAYLAFAAGGFFPDGHSVVALVLLTALVLRVTLAADPFVGLSPGMAVAAIGLAGLTSWTLASAFWSDAPARALVDADRCLVYLLALVLMGSIARTPQRLRWLLAGVAVATAGVAVIALATRLAPDVFPTASGLVESRLSYPLTYWNALGLVAAVGAIFCLYAATSGGEPPAVQVLGAAALPAVTTTILFTFSRGAILAGAFGVLVYVIGARTRPLTTGLAAAGPPTVAALVLAYDAELLASDTPTSAAAAAQGHELAAVLAALCAAAGLLRLALVPLDRRLACVPALPRRAAGLAGGGVLLAVLLACLALGVPGRVDAVYEEFTASGAVPANVDQRARLAEATSNGRVEQWDAALALFSHEPLHGTGAGTFGLHWSSRRPASLTGLVVDDAHSLYLETLAELGVIGGVLLALVVGAILVALAPVRRGADRPVYAALFAAAAAWAVHAGVDWDWEMPATTVWVFAAGGLALARPAARGRRRPVAQPLRVAVGLVAIFVALAPALLLSSERRLDRAVSAFGRGDCAAAITHATASLRALENRPEPYEVLGFCQTRRGFHRLAVEALQEAVARDPGNWEFHYGLALVRGAAGLDPRSAASAALELNPDDPRTQQLDRIARTRADRRRLLAARARTEQLSVVR